MLITSAPERAGETAQHGGIGGNAARRIERDLRPDPGWCASHRGGAAHATDDARQSANGLRARRCQRLRGPANLADGADSCCRRHDRTGPADKSACGDGRGNGSCGAIAGRKLGQCFERFLFRGTFHPQAAHDIGHARGHLRRRMRNDAENGSSGAGDASRDRRDPARYAHHTSGDTAQAAEEFIRIFRGEREGQRLVDAGFIGILVGSFVILIPFISLVTFVAFVPFIGLVALIELVHFVALIEAVELITLIERIELVIGLRHAFGLVSLQLVDQILFVMRHVGSPSAELRLALADQGRPKHSRILRLRKCLRQSARQGAAFMVPRKSDLTKSKKASR